LAYEQILEMIFMKVRDALPLKLVFGELRVVGIWNCGFQSD